MHASATRKSLMTYYISTQNRRNRACLGQLAGPPRSVRDLCSVCPPGRRQQRDEAERRRSEQAQVRDLAEVPRREKQPIRWGHRTPASVQHARDCKAIKREKRLREEAQGVAEEHEETLNRVAALAPNVAAMVGCRRQSGNESWTRPPPRSSSAGLLTHQPFEDSA